MRTSIRYCIESLVVVCLLALAGIGARSDAAESSDWHGGEYRDFTPGTQGMTVRGGVPSASSTPLGPNLKIAQTFVHRPRMSPGDLAALRVEYVVVAPAGSLEIKETRVIHFDGAVLARLTRVMSRPQGMVASEYRLKIPTTAAEGWYTVSTIIEHAQPETRAAAPADPANTAFYVELRGVKPLTQEASPPGGGVSPEDGVKIKLWAAKPQYKLGETVTLSFQTNRDAYVTLINVGTSGAITILFPNRFSGGNAVKGQVTYTIPGPDDNYELSLNEPPGTELIYALVTLKPVSFVATDFSRTKETFVVVTRSAEAFTRDINAVAKKTPLKEQAKAVLELEVVP